MADRLQRFRMLPARPGTCSVCATKHDELTPHNFWSLTYQMHFKLRHGRDATHADACAHLPEPCRVNYREILPEFRKEWTEPPAGVEPIAEPYAIAGEHLPGT